VEQTLSGFGGLTRVLVHPQVTWVGLGRCDAGDVGELAILDLGVRLSSRTWGFEVSAGGALASEAVATWETVTQGGMHSPGSPPSCCTRGSHHRSAK
jgi:hypothetical protein